MNDNLVHRALFSLPPIQPSAETALAVPELPPQRTVTGDREVDAMLWLRDLIRTGQPALIAKAKEAVSRIATPAKELEKRYTDHLKRTHPQHMFALLSAVGFAEPETLARLEKCALKNADDRHQAAARFGDMLFHDTPAEAFSDQVLDGVPATAGGWDLDKNQVDARFACHLEQSPATLTDCLHELEYWDQMYYLREAVQPESGEGSMAAQARKDYAFRCLGRIPPRTTTEAHAVLRYLQGRECMGWPETQDILMNLMTQQAGMDMPREIDGCMSATACDADHPSSREIASMEMIEPAAPASDDAGLQQWRAKLDPDLLRLRAQLLTPVMPPTGQDIVDVLEQLDALATICGEMNVCEFAIKVINGLTSIVDLDRLV